ncbi:DinB family protein [Paenibacillus rhizophilus]|uniref:DinB family protein n=1 Tax=Paenibacillus rhizophilus TaxID=1850366 RepID=A0A3N9P9A2_9BACL|nr:DinB family protein [Paenibacillus rhizophilus]RQW12818.1 DinB family protein [Paenibacillus rhizophilus]
MNAEQRKTWNEDHKRMTAMILIPQEHKEAVALLLRQHALLYAAHGDVDGTADYGELILKGTREEELRHYPVKSPDTRNSIVWHLWHSARVEDITMNMLVAGTGQVLDTDGMFQSLNIPFSHSGNEMTEAEMAKLSEEISIEGLLAYRRAVGRRTQEIIAPLEPGQFRRKVDAGRIMAVREQGAVTEKSDWLAKYWSGKTIGGLMLMPATRHNFVHLNKALRIKSKLQRRR